MKKTSQIRCLLAAFLCLLLSTASQAQDDAVFAAFAQQFQDAFNKEDHAALQALYTPDAVRVDREGKTITGAEQIGAFWAEQFKNTDMILSLHQTSVSWSDAEHAFVAKGTYRVAGTTVGGDKLDFSGSYQNTMLEKEGVWKIAKSVLGE
jgi:ketosteroid isomerase-like protein